MPIVMKTSLDYLPDVKRDELERLVGLVVAEFQDEIEMIILYGSYARGDWVEEFFPGGTFFQYQSDYDIMVITRDCANNRHTCRWQAVEAAFAGEKTPPLQRTLATISFFNRMLEHGYFFYVDIAKEGILLYDSGRCQLAEPRQLTPEEARVKAQAHYDEWFVSADEALQNCEEYLLPKNNLNWAAFILHQATERFLAAYLLVRTDYKPKVHDLERLVALAAAFNVEMLRVFPRGTKEEKRLFELLRSAYVDARYEPSYTITREELDYLTPRVELLRDLVRRSCLERIASLK